ncbi:MAG: ATP-binding cassette domain-containing protein [Candidatus Woesearchaeota archaeon]
MIKVKKLSKRFDSYERSEGFIEALKALVVRKKKVFEALKGISFDIPKGEIVGFLGPNGAGKSTTIKIISGIVYPDSGDVDVMGFCPWEDRKKYVSNIGVVFGQKSQLIWDLPAIDAFHFNKTIYKINDEIFQKQLDRLTNLLDIKEVMKRPARQLSLGERMRCEFAMALLHDPPLVFLDEPTIGLDIFAKETIREFIKQMNKEGKTFIVTSHDLEDIENLCHRLIIINHGKIVFDDSIEKLKVGRRKHISVSYYNAIDRKKLEKIPEIKIKKQYSDRSFMLEVDTSKKYLDGIIKEIRLGKRIKDIEIREPPVTEIIKKLYRKETI